MQPTLDHPNIFSMEALYSISKQPPYRHFSRTSQTAEDRPAKRIKLESSDKVQESEITTLKNANLGGRFVCWSICH